MTLNHDFPDRNPVDDNVSNDNNGNVGEENGYNDIVVMIIIVKMMIIMARA